MTYLLMYIHYYMMHWMDGISMVSWRYFACLPASNLFAVGFIMADDTGTRSKYLNDGLAESSKE